MMRSVAVIGSGISGLSVAHALAGQARVTLFEAGTYFGGHTNTVDVTLDGVTHGVDTGFLVLNERTYPQLLNLFAGLGVEIAKSEMSFSVQVPDIGLEWSGCDLNTVFAQRANLLRPLRFPVATMLRFCHNHGLLQVANRPQWYTVRGGARTYVHKMLQAVPDTRLNAPVRSVRRVDGGALVNTEHAGTERFDDVVLACHSDQSLALLADATPDERAILGAIRYQRNRALLHTDTALLPKRRRAWAAWNYEGAAATPGESPAVCLHYLIDRLQPLPFRTPVVVSLNPGREPRPELVHGEFDYAHPVFDAAAIGAQARVPQLQGVGNTWYCGAWTRYGFHEDGLMSALAVCSALAARQETDRVAGARRAPITA